jgi:hypothetical protein
VRAEHGQMLLRDRASSVVTKLMPTLPPRLRISAVSAADLVVFLLRNARVAERVDGDEQERQAERDDHAPADGHAEADVEVDVGHAVEAEGGDGEAHGHQLARIEFGREAPATGKRNMSAMPPEETAMPACSAE